MPSYFSFTAKAIRDESSSDMEAAQADGEHPQLVAAFLKANADYTVEDIESLVYTGQFTEIFPVSPGEVSPRKWPAERPWAPLEDDAGDDEKCNASTQ